MEASCSLPGRGRGSLKGILSPNSFSVWHSVEAFSIILKWSSEPSVGIVTSWCHEQKNISLGVPQCFRHIMRISHPICHFAVSPIKDNGHKSHNTQQVSSSTVNWWLRIWSQLTMRKYTSTFQVGAVLEEVIPLVSFCVRGWHKVVIFIFQILQVRVDHCNYDIVFIYL